MKMLLLSLLATIAGLAQAAAAAPQGALCQIEFTGQYYYASRDGQRMSDFTQDYMQAIQARDQLHRSGQCDGRTYNPTAVCEVSYTGTYYYVTRDGQRMSGFISDLMQTTYIRDRFFYNQVCQSIYPTSNCRLEFNGNFYYNTIQNQRMSGFAPTLDQALQDQRILFNQSLCRYPMAETCSIQNTGSLFYVDRSGNRLSGFVSNMTMANEILNQLRWSGNCF